MLRHDKSVPPCRNIGRFYREQLVGYAFLHLHCNKAALGPRRNLETGGMRPLCVANVPEHTSKNLEATVGPSFI